MEFQGRVGFLVSSQPGFWLPLDHTDSFILFQVSPSFRRGRNEVGLPSRAGVVGLNSQV